MHTADRIPSRELRVATVVITVLTLATFARGLSYPLMLPWDDGAFIVRKPDVHEISAASLRRIFTENRHAGYQPLTRMSYWLDVPWFGAQPFVLHAVNAGLGCASLALRVRVVVAYGLSVPAATFSTLVFGVHPVQVEVFTWATERKDIVALGLALSGSRARPWLTPRARARRARPWLTPLGLTD